MARIASIPRVVQILVGLTVVAIICTAVYLRHQTNSYSPLYRQTARKSFTATVTSQGLASAVKVATTKRPTGETGETVRRPPNDDKRLSNITTASVSTVAPSKHRNGSAEPTATGKNVAVNNTGSNTLKETTATPKKSTVNNTNLAANTSKGDGKPLDAGKPKEKELPSETEFKTFIHDDSYKSYMQCSTNPRKKLAESKIFKDRYIPDVPVLMWNESVTADEYERLSKFWSCYGWEQMTFEGVKETLKHLNTPGHRYMFDAGLHLKDKTGNNTGCIRCAVIGGGGILNGSRKGKEIDDHDYVFRVNIAATAGHEVDVGKKTTHYAFTMTTLRNSLLVGRRFGFTVAPHDENIHYLILPCEKADYILVENRASGKPDADFKARDPKHRGVPNFGKTVKVEDFKMLHPDFQRYMEFFWINSPRRYARINRPSTGALMLIAAIHTCDEVSAYGFGVNFKKYTTHYYDTSFTKFVYYANHDFNQELKLWNDLDKEGIINLYKREDD